MTNEQDLEPSQRVCHSFSENAAIESRLTSLTSRNVTHLSSTEDLSQQISRKMNRDRMPIVATIAVEEMATDVGNSPETWRWQHFYNQKPYMEDDQKDQIKRKTSIDNAICTENKSKLLEIKQQADQYKSPIDTEALVDRMKSNRTQATALENRLHAQREQYFQHAADIVKLFDECRSFGGYPESQANIDRKLIGYNTQTAALTNLLQSMQVVDDIQTDLDGTLNRLKLYQTTIKSIYDNDGQNNARARKADHQVQRALGQRTRWLLKQREITEPPPDFDAIQSMISNDRRLTISANETNNDFEILVSKQLKRIRAKCAELNKTLSLKVGYHFGQQLRQLNRAQNDLSKQLRQNQHNRSVRMERFRHEFDELTECFDAQAQYMMERCRVVMSPYLTMDENPTKPAVYCLMGLFGRQHMSTLYYQMTSIILKAAILIQSKCPTIVIESYTNLFDRPTGAAMLKYFNHLCEDELMQVICMFVTPPNRLDGTSSVHLVWDQSSASENVSEISNIIFNIDDTMESDTGPTDADETT